MSGAKSKEIQERMRRVIPFGSSTCSKSALYMPDEPGVIVRGKGCRVWDADGREFIDFRNSLGPITLGYCFPAVDEAIRAQLGEGIIFGHPHPVEGEVAEMLCDVVPCAERARFLKTGGEAMAACFRLARAYTGRDHVIQIGYNGWVNSLGAGPALPREAVTGQAPAGVPECLSRLHHTGRWNDAAGIAEVFDAFPGQVAAVAVAGHYPDLAAGADFYPALRDLCDRHGALLIFDEIVTGFRLAIGGAQEYFGVTPDLAVFAKGFANGMPLSVYLGRAEVMDMCDRSGPVRISITHGGEALSLAAAKAAIETYRDHDVVGHIHRQGERMWAGANALFERRGVAASFQGMWPCPQLTPAPEAQADLLERLLRALYRNGVSLYNTAYVNFSHADGDIDEALERFDRALGEL